MTPPTAVAPNRGYVPRPVVLCILDGWGISPDGRADSIALAKTPRWDGFMAHCPHAQIEASARDVGLPRGQMGNSEVGHMNLGAGRIVMQDLVRIDEAVETGTLAAMPALGHFIETLRRSGGAAHVLGLVSPGGVHAHQSHIAALVRILSEAGLPVRIHAILDGRDTPPKSAQGYVAELAQAIEGAADARLATVSGRFYAMDRDRRWDRVAAAYRAIAEGAGAAAESAAAAIDAGYARGVTDEFLEPTVLPDYTGMAPMDGILMANFRADRAREILAALVDPEFDGFRREAWIPPAATLGMVEYSEALSRLVPAIFPPEDLSETFGEIVARAGLRQLRIAETEKYAHVTFFFNGGREAVFEGEERILVPSPKVRTYDLEPAMSAVEVTDRLVAAIEAGGFDVVIANYANPDMVGHTGIVPAAVSAVETIDRCLGRLADALEPVGGALLITADHGNVEQMVDPETGEPHTAHTTNPVPVVLVGGSPGIRGLRNGRLADIAPTLLDLLKIEKPSVMTGVSILAWGVD